MTSPIFESLHESVYQRLLTSVDFLAPFFVAIIKADEGALASEIERQIKKAVGHVAIVVREPTPQMPSEVELGALISIEVGEIGVINRGATGSQRSAAQVADAVAALMLFNDPVTSQARWYPAAPWAQPELSARGGGSWSIDPAADRPFHLLQFRTSCLLFAETYTP